MMINEAIYLIITDKFPSIHNPKMLFIIYSYCVKSPKNHCILLFLNYMMIHFICNFSKNMAPLIIKLPSKEVKFPEVNKNVAKVKEDFEMKDYTAKEMLKRFTFWRAFILLVFLKTLSLWQGNQINNLVFQIKILKCKILSYIIKKLLRKH